jgi:hypothetical protein
MRTGGTRHPTADGVFRSHERGVSDRLPRASSCCDIRDTASSGVVKVEPYGERLLLMLTVVRRVRAVAVDRGDVGEPATRTKQTHRERPSKPRNPQRRVRNQTPTFWTSKTATDCGFGFKLLFRYYAIHDSSGVSVSSPSRPALGKPGAVRRGAALVRRAPIVKNVVSMPECDRGRVAELLRVVRQKMSQLRDRAR